MAWTESVTGISQSFPVHDLQGHTYRITSSASTQSSSGYVYTLNMYFDGVLKYSGSMPRSGSTSQVINEVSGSVTEGAYKLIGGSVGVYGSGLYTHNLSVSLNGYSIYSSGDIAGSTAIDSGTRTIQ